MFSCIARELKRVAARSGDELVNSIRRSFDGVHVEWVHTVVDFWSGISDRCIPFTLSQCYSFQIKMNANGQVVLRSKDCMHGKTWFPVGRHAEDLQFAQPLLLTRSIQWSGELRFVVPNVLDVRGLRSSCLNYSLRLNLQRSRRFPNEQAGDAMKWWIDFLDKEDKKIADMCAECRNIRVELGSIVVHRKKKTDTVGKAANAAKLARRDELLALLHSHECLDRKRGVLTVPDDYSRTLGAICALWKKTVADIDSESDHAGRVSGSDQSVADMNDSDSDSDDMTEHVSGLTSARSKSISVPKAYRQRGSKIEKGMVVAVHCSAAEGEFMGGQPFWLAKVLRITAKHITLHYYGDTFLGVYKLLDDEEILEYKRRDITILHWNIKFVGKYKHCGGRLSKGDQRVLSLDVRVPWSLPEHSSTVLGKRKQRSLEAQSSSRNTKRTR